MNLENTILSKRKQKQKTTYCMIPIIHNMKNKQVYRDRK